MRNSVGNYSVGNYSVGMETTKGPIRCPKISQTAKMGPLRDAAFSLLLLCKPSLTVVTERKSTKLFQMVGVNRLRICCKSFRVLPNKY